MLLVEDIAFEDIKILNRHLIQNHNNMFHEYYFHLTAEGNRDTEKRSFSRNLKGNVVVENVVAWQRKKNKILIECQVSYFTGFCIFLFY